MSRQPFSPTIRRVAITGGLGNLGTKLLRHLASVAGIEQLVGLDVRSAPPGHREQILAGLTTTASLAFVACDLADRDDQRWQQVLANTDAVVHFAAQNPYPEASWEEAAISLDMTLHVANAAVANGVQRVVFATSNHVMGGYKDDPLWQQLGPGGLTPNLPPAVGTRWHTGQQEMDSTAYATAKLYGERVCKEAATRANSQSTFAAIRIGWCQPGDNLPTTLSAAGTPTQSSKTATTDDAAALRSARWFREMWLSNRDFLQLFTRAITTNSEKWPHGFVLVNGMSNNQGMKWSLAETQQYLGYQPVDNAYAEERV
ncbi:MAG: NAD(P)-dependent oxidoreductase [Caldilineaceae bacterium]|nr:NAD(P)-dependent oxidoreductase [Caldilineaceae bacterium]